MTDNLNQPNKFQGKEADTQADQINAAADQYEVWRESIKHKTLREYWSELGIVVGKSVGGFKAIIAGDGAITTIARNAISALNALADLPKYRKLVWHEHIAQFEPRHPAYDRKVTWDIGLGLLVFWNWVNGSWRQSMLNWPVSRIIARYGERRPEFCKNLLNKRSNMIAKHSELEAYLASRMMKNSRYMIVLSTTEAREHFEKNIEPYLDQPFDVYYQAEIARWNDADVERKITNAGNERPNFHPEVPAAVVVARSEILEKLNDTLQPVEVYYTSRGQTASQHRTFDPNQPDNNIAPYISLAQIAGAPGSFKFSLDGDGATKKESKGKAAK